ADIDNNGDLEIIVISNRTVIDDNKLLAIFDYRDGQLLRIWESWLSNHQSKMFQVKSVVAADLDEDENVELYVVGEDSRILRFSNWNEEIGDFDNANYVYTHSSSLVGNLDIGDANNDGSLNLVFSDQAGKINVLIYNVLTDSFSHDKRSPFPPTIDLIPVYRVLAVKVADTDQDGSNEIAFLSQISSSSTLTTLQIWEKSVAKYLDSIQDNLPSSSITITEDYSGNSILVDDIDNDGIDETVIIGRDYVKVFGKLSFLDSSPPLEIKINDGINSPFMGGGAAIGDYNDDSNNELIIGCNNGSLLILKITDSGGDTLSYTSKVLEDLGSSLGYRNSIIIYDLDSDSETEIIISDNFGQNFILGKTAAPTVTITSPTSGSSFSSANVNVTWIGNDDLAIHHYEIFVAGNPIPQGKISGSQTQFTVSLINPTNLIEIVAYDVNNKTGSASISLSFSALAPEVHINSPENNFKTKSNQITVIYEQFDPNFDFDHFEIYVNEAQLTSYTINTSYLISLPSDGVYNITIIGVDSADYKGRSSIFVTKDSTPPTIDITSPTSGTFTRSSSVDLSWSASDALTDISYFEIYRDTQLIYTTTETSYTLDLDLDKIYSLQVKAFDELLNSKIDTISITKDTIQPSVSLLTPSDGFISTSQLVNLQWTNFDNIGGSGIHHTEITVNQLTKFTGTQELSTTIDMGTDGLKDIVITTYDKAGNIDTDHISIIIDNSNPILEILSPETSFTTGMNYVFVSWASADNGSGLKEFQIYVNGALQQTITDPLARYAKVVIPINQDSTIVVRAVDNTDRIYEDSILVHQSSSLPSIELTQPAIDNLYFNTSIIDISWEIANITNFIRYEIYLNSSNIENITNIAITSFELNLTSFITEQYPLFNLTLVVVTTDSNNTCSSKRLINIDQSPPNVIFISPGNNSQFYNSLVYFQWSGVDDGSGVYRYEFYINNTLFSSFSYERNYLYTKLDSYDGAYRISIKIFDNALNSYKTEIFLTMYILLPEISFNVPQIYYSKTGIFDLNITIANPHSGVKKIILLIDNNEAIRYNYDFDIQFNPFFITYSIIEDDYGIGIETHDIKVAITDYYNRESFYNRIVIVDSELPNILDSISLGSQIFSDEPLEIIKDSQNEITIIVTVTDNYGIESVILKIEGPGVNNSYQMEQLIEGKAQTVQFTITINIQNYSIGDYQLTFNAFDFAGNNVSIIKFITILAAETTPWIFQGQHLLYIGIGIGAVLYLVIFLSIALHGPIVNKNWREELIAVIYIKQAGLTAVYVPYSERLIQEEQLIGGAMVAIQGILDEISVDKDRKKIDVMEIGDKSLLILVSKFGISVVMVKDVKPKHKELLKKFTKNFERKYENPLKSLYSVDSNSFNGATELVTKYFGPLTEKPILSTNGLVDQLKVSKQEYEADIHYGVSSENQNAQGQQLSPIDELLLNVSKEAKRGILKIIKILPQIIISITEKEFAQSEELIGSVTLELEFLLKLERTNDDLTQLLETVLNLIREAQISIEADKTGNTRMFELAVEKMTNLWFNEITEKWSNIK
ncbi:MAG: Ig-like domain-containing protein, partial [Candidatus Thorarchaeota archaeon]